MMKEKGGNYISVHVCLHIYNVYEHPGIILIGASVNLHLFIPAAVILCVFIEVLRPFVEVCFSEYV